MPLPEFLVDPNIVYIIVWLALWVGVTAFYLPGTGILEGLAVVGIAGAILLLTTLPTNWVALLILIVGMVSFLVMPFINVRLAPIAVIGLVLQAIGGLMLFTDTLVSPLVIGATVAVSLAYHYFVLLPILAKLKAQAVKPVDREDQMIGMRGRVVKPLRPVGTVQANGELWSATSTEDLEAGTPVIIVDRDGLQLIVEPLKDKRVPQNGRHVEENLVE